LAGRRAVGLEPDARGDYRVKSFYLVTGEEMAEKRRRGHIHLAPL
jgi:hypothetical protein